MKTPDEYSKLISIEQQKLNIATSPEQKQSIQKQIQKLDYRKEIARIQLLIQNIQ